MARGGRLRVQHRHISGSQKKRQLSKETLERGLFGQLAWQAGEKMLEVIKKKEEKE